jgi:hypothetical protein
MTFGRRRGSAFAAAWAPRTLLNEPSASRRSRSVLRLYQALSDRVSASLSTLDVRVLITLARSMWACQLQTAACSTIRAHWLT